MNEELRKKQKMRRQRGNCSRVDVAWLYH